MPAVPGPSEREARTGANLRQRHRDTEITGDEIAARITALRAANATLRQRSLDDTLDSLDRVIAAWLSHDSPWRRQAEDLLPAATGFSAEMIRYGLPLLLEPLRGTAVRDLLDRELGSHPPLGPTVIAHIMSGNIPALSASSIVLSLAIGSCALVKAASGDRVFPSLFAASIAAADAELGACVAATYWSGGNRAIEEVVFRQADLVVAFGSDASIAAMRDRSRARFIGHGHRISFALITRELLTSETTMAGLAEDLSLWDQRGCLSPQVCFIEGDYDDACAFAAALGPRLDAAASRLPPGVLDAPEHTAIRRFRDDAEWRALAGERVRLLTPPSGLAWSIVVEATPLFRPTPLGRSLRILPLERIDNVRAVVAPTRGMLEAAGVATPPDRRQKVQTLLKDAGVHWITAVGQMQKPPLAWTQGGRPRVADWIDPRRKLATDEHR